MDTTALLAHQGVWALFASLVIEYLKNSKWMPLITNETAKLNRILAVAASGLAAAGVHSAFDHTTGVLTITGLTVAGISTGVREWVRTWIIQEIGYQNLIRGKFGPVGSSKPDPAPAASSAQNPPAVPPLTPAPQH